jgi:competence CoiA-like predicted nuclease
MIWALKDGERINATPTGKALCPICSGEVIAKCGVVKAWHWSHKSLVDCDSWAEPESEWHLKWKNEFPKEQQEVVIEKFGIKHRADIQLDSGHVIELQNSSISSDDICDREKFYESMVWLLNGETMGKNFEIREKPSYFTFVWKNPPTSFFHSESPIFIDLSNQLNEFEDMENDINERLDIIFNELKKIINDDPHKFNFNALRYNTIVSEEQKKILEKNDVWHNLSIESNENTKKLDLFKNGTIFFIKKLYKKIPCAGWGYLISKGEFINGQKES